MTDVGGERPSADGRIKEHQLGVARAIAEATWLTAYNDPERMALALRCALAHAEAWLHEWREYERRERARERADR